MRIAVEELERRVLLNAGESDGVFNGGNPLRVQPLVGKYLADATAVAVQADGKILTAGHASNLIALARSNADGTPDLSFGTNGGLLTSVEANAAGSEQVVIQPDGKILESGGQSVVRFNPDGSPDATFGNAGLASIPGFNLTEVMMLASDGSIIIASGLGQLQITRLNADGSLDRSFGGGVVSVSAAQGQDWTALSLAIDGSGNLLVGATQGFSNYVLSFRPDGTANTAFASSGSLRYGEEGVSPQAIRIQPDGSIMLGGWYATTWGMEKLNSAGAVDTSFGVSGVAKNTALTLARGSVYLFGPDGSLLAAGVANSQTFLSRLNADGSLDTFFGGNTGHPGVAQFQFGVPAIDDLAVGLDGSIFASESSEFFEAAVSPFATIRCDPTGALAASFGGANGYASQAFSGPVDTLPTHVATAPDGKVVVGGVYWAAEEYDVFVARYNIDGTPDQSFGTSGVSEIHLSQYGTTLGGIAVLGDGDVALGGSASSQFFVARLTADGTLDKTFGTNGVSTTVPGANYASFTGGYFAADSSGHLIVAGTSQPAAATSTQVVVTRFRSDGSLDPAFGANGVALAPNGTPTLVTDVAVAADGDVVVSSAGDLIEFNSDGAPNQSFGVGGISVISNQTSVRIDALATTPGGEVVAAAEGNPPGGTGPFVFRTLANGQLDSTFGVGGFVSSSPNEVFDPRVVVVQSDGKILLTGDTSALNGTALIARLSPDGSPDLNFGTSGGVLLANAGADVSSSRWSNLCVDSADRITAIGLATLAPNDTSIHLVERYLGTDPASISGRVFNDANMNGSLDSGEAGLSSVAVYLDLNNNGIHDTGEPIAVTDAAGNYSFGNLAPGSYTLREAVPAGYGQTSPMGYSQTVLVAAGRQATGPDFGNAAISSVPMNLAYLLLLARNFGKPGTFATGDLNGDGTVDAADLLLLVRHFGHTLPTPAASRLAMRRC